MPQQLYCVTQHIEERVCEARGGIVPAQSLADVSSVLESLNLAKHQYQFLQRVIYRIVKVKFAAQSRAWVCGRSPGEIVDLNPTGGMDVSLL
jgi:hypothetical protein